MQTMFWFTLILFTGKGALTVSQEPEHKVEYSEGEGYDWSIAVQNGEEDADRDKNCKTRFIKCQTFQKFRERSLIQNKTKMFFTKSTFPVSKVWNEEITPCQAVRTLRKYIYNFEQYVD